MVDRLGCFEHRAERRAILSPAADMGAMEGVFITPFSGPRKGKINWIHQIGGDHYEMGVTYDDGMMNTWQALCVGEKVWPVSPTTCLCSDNDRCGSRMCRK